ncbi:MAG TPA: hypothetical protein PK122_06965, partial [Candidatus Paceibacterota bacterium]|nr:hypothetical protein [Candidatus Paceibacterota bacterium]
MKLLTHNHRGVQDLLTIINKLKDKNDTFLNNTFRWLINSHPPFPGSFIVYKPQTNEYIFWKPRKGELRIRDWDSIRGDDFFKIDTFYYGSFDPNPVIISKADWILRVRNESENEKKESINRWISWYHNQVDREREYVKKFLISSS